MLFKLFTPKEMVGRGIDPDLTSTWNKHVRKKCRERNIKIVEHAVKFKNPVKYSNKGAQVEAQTRKEVEELIRAKPYINNNFLRRNNLDEDNLNECFIGIIKVELADEDFYTIVDKLEALEEDLAEFDSQIYIKYVDITQD